MVINSFKRVIIEATFHSDCKTGMKDFTSMKSFIKPRGFLPEFHENFVTKSAEFHEMKTISRC